jgi:hypothetical protein
VGMEECTAGVDGRAAGAADVGGCAAGVGRRGRARLVTGVSGVAGAHQV